MYMIYIPVGYPHDDEHHYQLPTQPQAQAFELPRTRAVQMAQQR